VKLTDIQLILLSAAAQRDDHAVQIPPEQDRTTIEKLAAKLMAAGLIEEVEAGSTLPEWRRADDIGFALRITKQGLNAIGVEENEAPSCEPETAPIKVVGSKRRAAPKKKGSGVAPPQALKKATKRFRSPKPPAKARAQETGKTRVGTKLDHVKGLMARKRGASIAEMMEATHWLPHTTRAVLTGLRKKGIQIEREAIKDKPTIYRITGETNSPASTRRPSSQAA
jgi:hypothetical protein